MLNLGVVGNCTNSLLANELIKALDLLHVKAEIQPGCCLYFDDCIQNPAAFQALLLNSSIIVSIAFDRQRFPQLKIPSDKPAYYHPSIYSSHTNPFLIRTTKISSANSCTDSICLPVKSEADPGPWADIVLLAAAFKDIDWKLAKKLRYELVGILSPLSVVSDSIESLKCRESREANMVLASDILSAFPDVYFYTPNHPNINFLKILAFSLAINISGQICNKYMMYEMINSASSSIPYDFLYDQLSGSLFFSEYSKKNLISSNIADLFPATEFKNSQCGLILSGRIYADEIFYDLHRDLIIKLELDHGKECLPALLNNLIGRVSSVDVRNYLHAFMSS